MLDVEGGCLCGVVRYRVKGTPMASVICHCTSCRKAAGAPSVAWVTFPAAQFEWTRGEPRSHRSSTPVLRTFCDRCGTPLTYAHASRPQEIDLTTLSLDDPTLFPPRQEVWMQERVVWEAANPALRPFPRGGA
jgi:hypothetical protein